MAKYVFCVLVILNKVLEKYAFTLFFVIETKNLESKVFVAKSSTRISNLNHRLGQTL